MEKVRVVKAGGSLRKIGQTPTKSSDFPFQARSRIELAKKFKQIKKEKIDKLHERLQENNIERVQEIVEDVEETPKKRTHRKRIRKIDGNLDKRIVTNKMERPNILQPKVMKDSSRSDKEVVQETPNKRTHEKAIINALHVHANNREMVQNFDGNMDKQIAHGDRICTRYFFDDIVLKLGMLKKRSPENLPDNNKEKIQKMEKTQKFVLPIEARDWVETTVRDAWRRYKYKIKKDHFLKYSILTESLKHRPPKVPESHFRKLCEYWNSKPIQLAKEKREPTQAEIFVETRKGNKGKALDVETEKVIERPGMVRCYGRNVTKTSLKQKEEINALKKAHNEEVSVLVENFEDKIGKLQHAFKTLTQHCNPQINMQSIEDLLGFSHGDANGSPIEAIVQMHSSTSTHAPRLKKQDINGDCENDNELFQDDDVGDKFQDDEFEM
uniref:Uncharacterized protein LOC101511970 n=1 Tax=Cicer arietinum TaxID=3827 RepID=A0A1S2Z6L0_CICAR|nr:uncharacterized protein LOC101511970 [Cicer arietinum]